MGVEAMENIKIMIRFSEFEWNNNLRTFHSRPHSDWPTALGEMMGVETLK